MAGQPLNIQIFPTAIHCLQGSYRLLSGRIYTRSQSRTRSWLGFGKSSSLPVFNVDSNVNSMPPLRGQTAKQNRPDSFAAPLARPRTLQPKTNPQFFSIWILTIFSVADRNHCHCRFSAVLGINGASPRRMERRIEWAVFYMFIYLIELFFAVRIRSPFPFVPAEMHRLKINQHTRSHPSV